MNLFFKNLLILFLAFIPFVALSQNGSKSKEKLKEKKEAKAKSSEKLVKEAEDFHMKIQAKETRKRMKEDKKKSAMINSNSREPFYKRWFRKKHH